MNRKDAIKILQRMQCYISKSDYHYVGYSKKDDEAFDIAIASLKTDEAYQLEYENREVIPKDEVLKMLMDLKIEVGKMSDTTHIGNTITITSWKGMQDKIINTIQRKIYEVKERT